MLEDKIVYFDRPGYRVLDLRPDGVTCIPAIGLSDFSAVRNAPEFHYHAGVMEFCLCLKGNLTFETEETEYKFLPGQMFVSAPDQPHRLKNNPKGLNIYRLLFTIPRYGTKFLGLDMRESEWLARSLMNLPKRVFQSTPRIKEAFDKMFDLYDNARPSPGRRARMKSAALDLLLAIVDAARRLPSKSPDSILAIARRIRENPEKDYPVAELAKDVGLSRSAFSDLFKKSLGLPLHAYVINSRILKAQKLLENTARPISDIAAELGFAAMPHFITTFKRVIGKTPFAFRKELAQKAR